MKKANITLSYEEEKIQAVRLYLKHKNLILEDELRALIDALYKKHVPIILREYFDLRDGAVTEKSPQKAADTTKTQD